MFNIEDLILDLRHEGYSVSLKVEAIDMEFDLDLDDDGKPSRYFLKDCFCAKIVDDTGHVLLDRRGENFLQAVRGSLSEALCDLDELCR